MFYFSQDKINLTPILVYRCGESKATRKSDLERLIESVLAPLLSSGQMSRGKLRQMSVYFLTELSSAMTHSNFCDIST